MTEFTTLHDYEGDGTRILWDINFTGGFISDAHVVAEVTDNTGVTTDVSLEVLSASQVKIEPAVADGLALRIRRNTPKDLPIVDFSEGAVVNETNLDTNALQAVFIAAEAYELQEALPTKAELDGVLDRAESLEDNLSLAIDDAEEATAAANSAAEYLTEQILPGVGGVASLIINADGITATATIAGFKTGGTSDLSPDDAPKLMMVLAEHGFDELGNPTTVDHSVVGTVHGITKAPNDQGPIESATTATVSVTYTLSHPVSKYAQEGAGNIGYKTIAVIRAGLYTDDGPSGSNEPSLAVTVNVVNLSQREYAQPFGNLSMLTRQIYNDNVRVELVGGHPASRDLRPWAAIKAIVTDSVGTEFTNTSIQTGTASMAKDVDSPDGQVMYVDVDTTAAVGGVANVDYILYPFIGDTPFDTREETLAGADWRNGEAATFPIRIDKTGDYDKVYAQFDATGDDGTGTVEATEALAAATPYATEAAAVTALQAHNATRGHDDLASAVLVRGKDTAGFESNWASARTTNGGHFTILGDLASRGRKITQGTFNDVIDGTIIENITLENDGTDPNKYLIDGLVDNVAVGPPQCEFILYDSHLFYDSAYFTGPIYKVGLWQVIGSKVSTQSANTFSMQPSKINRIGLWLQSSAANLKGLATASEQIDIQAITVNGLYGDNLALITPADTFAHMPEDGYIFNNWILDQMTGPCAWLTSSPNKSRFVAENWVAVNPVDNGQGVVLCSTETDHNQITGCVVLGFFTARGPKVNWFYSIGDAADNNPVKEGYIRGGIVDNANCKSAAFGLVQESIANPEEVNLFVRRGVGAKGNHFTTSFGSSATAGNTADNSIPSYWSWIGEYLGLTSTHGDTVAYQADGITPVAGQSFLLNKFDGWEYSWPNDVLGNPRRVDGTGSGGGVNAPV